MEGVDLRGATAWSARLDLAVLDNARLQGADLHWSSLRMTQMRGAELQGVRLEGAVLRGADLSGAILQGASLQEADLQGALLESAQLQGANLFDARLQAADVRDAKFHGVVSSSRVVTDFTEIVRRRIDEPTQLTGIVYDTIASTDTGLTDRELRRYDPVALVRGGIMRTRFDDRVKMHNEATSRSIANGGLVSGTYGRDESARWIAAVLVDLCLAYMPDFRAVSGWGRRLGISEAMVRQWREENRVSRQGCVRGSSPVLVGGEHRMVDHGDGWWAVAIAGAGVPPRRQCDPPDDSTHNDLVGRGSHGYCC